MGICTLKKMIICINKGKNATFYLVLPADISGMLKTFDF